MIILKTIELLFRDGKFYDLKVTHFIVVYFKSENVHVKTKDSARSGFVYIFFSGNGKLHVFSSSTTATTTLMYQTISQ